MSQSKLSSAKGSVRQERQPARDEAEEVAPGVLRIQLPIALPGLGHVNCYAMEDSRGVALVDPGLPGPTTWRQLKKRLARAGLAIDRVHTVVVTHSHPDHFGQAARFRAKVGAEIVTHRSFRTFLDADAENDDYDSYTVVPSDPAHSHEHGHSHDHGSSNGDSHQGDGDGADDDRRETVEPDRRAASVDASRQDPRPYAGPTPWGGRPYDVPLSRRLRFMAMRWAAGRFLPTPAPTRTADDADVLELGGREWVSVHTPGHTQDHLCLWDPANGVMISGDHVLPTITPHISGMGATVDPLADFFQSLDRMQTFGEVTTVLPAHGLEFDDLSSRAESIKVHHHERLDTLRRTGGELGPGTVGDYMQQLFQARSWGPMAESETYAHLEHLRLAGEATVSSDGEQLRYAIRD